MTFMKYFGDYYDIYEIEKEFISNASWEIRSIMEVSKLPWLQKKEYQE